MPSATAVVARSYPDKIIGIDNQLPWHLGTDLREFRKRTEGHAIIMGRKTYDSIGRPLPKRHNIVLSHTPDFANGRVSWVQDRETALFLADIDSIINGRDEFFVIGGQRIYEVFNSLINRVVMTEVFCGNINGDAKFEYEYRDNPEWRPMKEIEYPKSGVDDFAFRITEYVRRKPAHRWRSREEFMGRVPDMDEFLFRYEVLAAEGGPDDGKREKHQSDLFEV